MKPKTIEQERVVKWTNLYGDLTSKQAAYAKRHCFNDEILESRGKCLCTACKHTWRIKGGGAEEVKRLKCPHCCKKLEVTHHCQKVKRSAYFTVVTTKANMQAVKWYLVTRRVSQADDALQFVHVGTEWVDTNGNHLSVELPRFTMCWRKDQWVYGKAMELRKNSVFSKYLVASATYYARVLPVLKRNGWNGNHQFDFCFTDVARNLMGNRHFESWFKVGHYGVCFDWLHREMNCLVYHANKAEVGNDEMALIKLANRKRVVFDTRGKWREYLSYMKDLEELHQDIHNPKILFPDDFQAVSQQISERANRKRERQRERLMQQQNIEFMRRKAENDRLVRAWVSKYTGCFNGMTLVNGKFTVSPLISVGDFEREAAQMHHCIMTYYGKKNTLLLSVEHDGKKCETAEVDLLGAGRVVQCRGVNNLPSNYHDEIVKMLNGYMTEFVRRFRHPVVKSLLPVPANYYRQLQMAI